MRPVRVVAISSLDGGVGKTTLATVLAIAKGYTLLVDMDWEKADLSQLFRAPRRVGWLAPFLKGERPYVHRVNPMLYLIPGYEAFEVYQKLGEEATGDFQEALLEWASYMPKFVQSLRIPVDTVVIDTTAALRLEVLARLQHMGVFTIFMSDRRLISRISDIKNEQYRKYMAYSTLVAINMVDRDEVKMAKKIAPVVLKRVKISEYYGEAVANSVLGDRENRRSIEQLVMRIKI
ncbi:MAG: ParA family protein [Pyrobaculum sp.]